MKPLHVYPMGQAHLMHPACSCDPMLVVDQKRAIWIHRLYDFDRDKPMEGALQADLEFIHPVSEYIH